MEAIIIGAGNHTIAVADTILVVAYRVQYSVQLLDHCCAWYLWRWGRGIVVCEKPDLGQTDAVWLIGHGSCEERTSSYQCCIHD